MRQGDSVSVSKGRQAAEIVHLNTMRDKVPEPVAAE
jgi:hypothetical protein